MQALGCIFGAVVLMFAQFGAIVYGIFVGIKIFVAYIIRQWDSHARLQAILLYGLLCVAIAIIWTVANELAVECSRFLGAQHSNARGIFFLSSLLALSFIGIASYHQHKESKKE